MEIPHNINARMHSPPCIRAFMLWLTELKKLVVAVKGILQHNQHI